MTEEKEVKFCPFCGSRLKDGPPYDENIIMNILYICESCRINFYSMHFDYRLFDASKGEILHIYGD